MILLMLIMMVQKCDVSADDDVDTDDESLMVMMIV